MIKNHYETTEQFCTLKTKQYNEYIGGVIEKIQKLPSRILPSFFRRNMDMLRVESVVHGGSDLSWLYLRRAQQSFTGHFQLSLNDGKEFMLDFDDGVLPVTGKYKNCYTGANDWVTAFYLAIIMRNMKAISILSQVSEDIFKADEQGSDNFDNQLAALYKAIFNPAANFAEQLVITTASFIPDEFTDARFKYVNRIFWPQLAIIQAIFTPGSEDKFNELMTGALKLHKEYWKKKSHELAAEGVISLPLTALAVLAHDHAGYKLTVKNGYILDSFVTAENAPIHNPSQAHSAQTTEPTEIPFHVLKALKECDGSELESLREQNHTQYLPALIALYEAEENWDLRGGIVALLVDRTDSTSDILSPLMNDALNSPDHQTRGLALVWLYNDLSVYDQILGDYGIDEQKVDGLLKKYLAAQSQ